MSGINIDFHLIHCSAYYAYARVAINAINQKIDAPPVRLLVTLVEMKVQGTGSLFVLVT